MLSYGTKGCVFFFFYCWDNDYMNVNQNTVGIQKKGK